MCEAVCSDGSTFWRASSARVYRTPARNCLGIKLTQGVQIRNVRSSLFRWLNILASEFCASLPNTSSELPRNQVDTRGSDPECAKQFVPMAQHFGEDRKSVV